MSECFAKFPIEDNTMFSINIDGTYVLTILSSDSIGHDTETNTSDYSCLLQCYSNGYINRVDLKELMSLRRNYTYSHGIYTSSSLLYCGICSENDFIISQFEKTGKQYLSITPISSLALHSMLGLKGDKAIKTTFDAISKCYLLTNELSSNITNLIAFCSRNGYVGSDESTLSNELRWLFDNIIKQDLGISQLEEVPATPPNKENGEVEEFDFSSLIGIDNQDALRQKFNGYLKKGREIPIGQRYVKDVLSLCKNKEDFWLAVKTLLECHVIIYRSPIVAYFNSNPNDIYYPDLNTLTPIIKLIFSTNDKIEKNLEFLYPFRTLLTKEILQDIQSRIKGLSKPEDFHNYGVLFNYSSQELIDYCFEEASPASYYCVYEILQKVSKKEGFFGTKKLLDSISDKIDDSRIEGKLIKKLLYNDFQKNRANLSPDIIKIKSGGYKEYLKILNSYEGKKKFKEELKNITSYVGKRVDARLVASYQNHYLLQRHGVRILLPKDMATQTISKHVDINVFIAMADKAYDTLLATQREPVSYKMLMETPLLNAGDIIELTFNINGTITPHKCYKKIRVAVASYPKGFDYKARYQARVIRQTSDKYHFLVKLIKTV